MSERLDGRLTSWNDERGFGFITTLDGSRLFVHIKEFGYGGPRPELGDVVSYRLGRSADGRPQAVQVQGIGGSRASRRVRPQSVDVHGADSSRASRPGRSRAIDYLPIVLFIGCYVAAEHYWNVPSWVAVLYVVASLVTVIAYAVDKSRAKRGRWRISEGTLNLLAFLGGWPGAVLAQQTLRHKTIKASFRKKFWMAVVANIIIFVALASPWGRELLGIAVAQWQEISSQ